MSDPKGPVTDKASIEHILAEAMAGIPAEKTATLLPTTPTAHKTTSAMISKIFKKDGTIVKEVADEDLIRVNVPPDEVPLASVSVNGKMTINLGNFESVTFGVHVTVPAIVEDIESSYRFAKAYVDRKLGSEMAALREARAERSHS